jgi:hypothetical protein
MEILFIYELARNPPRAMAKRWWCPSLFRAPRAGGNARGAGKSQVYLASE